PLAGLLPHEERDQGLVAHLGAAVPVNLGIEAGAFGQGVGGEEVLARPKDARGAILQADLHGAGQDEHPLRRGGAVELRAKADRALAQLHARGREELRKHRLGRAFAQRDVQLPKAGPSIDGGEEFDLHEGAHLARLRLSLRRRSYHNRDASRAVSMAASSSPPRRPMHARPKVRADPGTAWPSGATSQRAPANCTTWASPRSSRTIALARSTPSAGAASAAASRWG